LKVIIDIDLDRPGKQTGYIRIAQSSDDSAYGWILIPVVSLRNGDGPRILCVGGVHGDEFEGQIVWTRLARELRPEAVAGHILIIPALNVPAAIAGRRVSPIDGVNLNRCFPGNPRGTATERIAHIVEAELLPRFDLVIDIHSGGNSSVYLPGPTITLDPDPVAQAEMVRLLTIFGGPQAFVFDESGGRDAAMIGACRRVGMRRLGSEMGGGGNASPATIAATDVGVRRVLTHLGAISGELAAEPSTSPTRLLRRFKPLSEHYHYADEGGVFESLVELGDSVAAGAPLGRIVFPDTPWREPVPCRSQTDGIVICRRAKGRTARGDGVVILGEAMAT